MEEIPASVFDTVIRQAGWHFMWAVRPCVRRGFGVTREAATTRALIRALRSVASRFNAAELDSVTVAKYPGFYIANVTLQSRQIQEHTSLDNVDERYPQAATAG
jgi:P2-related tail formation protein